jgi:metal-dependent amidase/aminoacylase/carboxypeptidase family protein
MKKFVCLLLMMLGSCANMQCSSITPPPVQEISAEELQRATDTIADKLIQIRRKLHAYPELAGNEINTQSVVKQYLLDLGLEVKTDMYGYAVVGILKGATAGKSVAWRADMDALPNDFPDNVDFKSTIKGVQHGCGHDVHVAIALGIAEVLAKHKKALRGTVFFIFQPEEERFTGAKGMVDKNVFSTINPSEVYGLHITPASFGQILVKSNEMYSYQKGLRIQLKNTVSSEAVNELMAKIRTKLVRVANNTQPWDLQRILDPKDGLASPSTIYKDYAILDRFTKFTRNDTLFLEADFYETEKSRLQDIIPAVREAVVAQGLSAQLHSVTFFKENPTIDNDPKLTEIATNTLNSVYGQGTVTRTYGQVPFSNDDFAYFQQKVPGVYFFFGGSNFEKGMIAMIHAPNFMVDEQCIGLGVRMFSTLLSKRLSAQ